MINSAEVLRKKRQQAAGGLWRHHLKKPNLKANSLDIGGALCGAIISAILMAGIAFFIVFKSPNILKIITYPISYILDFSTFLCLALVLLIYSINFIVAFRYKKWPDSFSLPTKIIRNFLIASLLISIIYHLIPNWSLSIKAVGQWIIDKAWLLQFNKGNSTHPSFTITNSDIANYFICAWIFLFSFFTFFTAINLKNSTQNKGNLQKRKKISPYPFGIWLGTSTGELAKRSHRANIASHQQVGLFNDDVAQNLLILGGISSGKTTRAIHPLLLQLFDQDCGGLIFDIKGDFHQAVNKYAHITKRTYCTLGVNDTPFNLLAGLTPEMVGSFLESVFLLSGESRGDPFWVKSGTALCRNALGVLSFRPEHYSLHGLYLYIFNEEWHEEYMNSLEELLPSLTPSQQRLLDTYHDYEKNVFSEFKQETQSSVKATVAEVLSPFNHPALIDAFCIARPDSARLEDVLNGAVFLLNLPLSQWGWGGRVVYTMLKLRLFNIMQQRTQHPEWNQSRYVFLLCDEYQEIVSASKNGLSDLNFWDKSRSSKTIGIISAQSVSSFYAAIGNHDTTDALLQNFRQKICFRTEDQNTMQLFTRILGTVEVHRMTESQNRGSSSGKQSSSHQGSGSSLAIHERPLLDGQFFRDLPAGSALAVLSIHGAGYDDVLKLEPFYV